MTKEPAQDGIAPPPGTPAPQTRRDWRELLRAVVGESAAVDVAVYDAVASTRTPNLDRTMAASSDAAT